MLDNPHILKTRREKVAFSSIDFHPTRNMLISCGMSEFPRDTSVHSWTLDTFEMSKHDHIALSAHKVRYAPSGDWLALLGNGITVLDASLSEKFILKPGGESIVISPNSRYIASGSGRDNSLYLWDIKTQNAIHLRGGKHGDNGGGEEGVRAVAFTPDGRFLVSGGMDNTIRFWDIITGEQSFLLKNGGIAYPGGIFNVIFSPNGEIMAVATEQGEVQIWDWRAKEKVKTLYEFWNNWHPTHMAFSPNGSLFAAGQLKDLRLWGIGDIAKGSAGYSLNLPESCHNITDIVFSPNGKLLATAHDYEALLWQVSIGG